ncbi:EAL domain-containing protein [Lysinibacillus sp. 2017]|uniref:EAL and HDOD domain-containing protein n=1 Tax=unclassified Lysinibacillus TaxID=2636778 RepID=UPI000D5264C2|nr:MULTISPECIES: HDOD domain-containing protein [unclassified Lysinibacillus]AWE08645.1 EAL domain-containing protein [Lysinibacillus sp. 2017]TGN35066.1 HDOD domain-containing protein [Lysinibacillus sp. S2017]
MEIFIGRQPIFNVEEEVVAYELLYRNNMNNAFPDIDSDSATLDVIINSFLSIGINEVANGRPSFVNFTENLILSESFDFIDPTALVIEVLEDVPITNALIDRLKILKSRGFKIALDDFVLNEEVLIYDELFSYIDYIKVDFLLTPVLERMEIENKIKSQFPSIKLLAEKVETRDEFELAKHTGYSLFQGYFFEEPQIIKSTDIPANLLQYFQIIILLRNEELSIDLLAESMEREISLSYKLLQLINNSAKRTKSKVRSIKQAILLLGLTELRKWIYLLAMRESDEQSNNDVFKELMYSSLFRAKVCEKLARRNNKDNYSEYFLVGLFSLIDSLLQRPMNTILSKLPLSETLLETISGEMTEMTPYLQMSIALNKLEWDQIEPLTEKFTISHQELIEINEEVILWVEDALIVS